MGEARADVIFAPNCPPQKLVVSRLWTPSTSTRADVILALPVAPPPEHLWCPEVASVGGDVSSFTTNCTLQCSAHCILNLCTLYIAQTHTSTTHFNMWKTKVLFSSGILYSSAYLILKAWCNKNWPPYALLTSKLVRMCCNILATCHTC